MPGKDHRAEKGDDIGDGGKFREVNERLVTIEKESGQGKKCTARCRSIRDDSFVPCSCTGRAARNQQKQTRTARGKSPEHGKEAAVVRLRS